MNLNEINLRARQMLRDTNKTIFEEVNVNNFINEAIDRIRSIKALEKMEYLVSPDQSPTYLPEQYHHLLSVYCASRCFFQDEQMQQSVSLMNEFESKVFELKSGIESGDIDIKDPDDNLVDSSEWHKLDHIKDVYFHKSSTSEEVITSE